jgi:hypothetical protein
MREKCSESGWKHSVVGKVACSRKIDTVSRTSAICCTVLKYSCGVILDVPWSSDWALFHSDLVPPDVPVNVSNHWIRFATEFTRD